MKLLLTGMSTGFRKGNTQREEVYSWWKFECIFPNGFCLVSLIVLVVITQQLAFTLACHGLQKWVFQLGYSYCSLEQNIKDSNHTDNYKNTGIMFNWFLFLSFPIFFYTILYNTIVIWVNCKSRVLCFDKSGIRQQMSAKEDHYNTKTKSYLSKGRRITWLC